MCVCKRDYMRSFCTIYALTLFNNSNVVFRLSRDGAIWPNFYPYILSMHHLNPITYKGGYNGPPVVLLDKMFTKLAIFLKCPQNPKNTFKTLKHVCNCPSYWFVASSNDFREGLAIPPLYLQHLQEP